MYNHEQIKHQKSHILQQFISKKGRKLDRTRSIAAENTSRESSAFGGWCAFEEEVSGYFLQVFLVFLVFSMCTRVELDAEGFWGGIFVDVGVFQLCKNDSARVER